jgi:hypothetical protein
MISPRPIAVFIPITHEGARPSDGGAGFKGTKRADTDTQKIKQRIIFDIVANSSWNFLFASFVEEERLAPKPALC